MKPVSLTQFFTRMLWNIGRSTYKKRFRSVKVEISHMSAILGFTVGGIIIAYVREKNFKHFSFNKRFVESVWPAEYKNQKDYSGFQNSLYFPPMRRFQRYPKFADRKIQKILRFTGFFNLLKSSAQSSEYLFKKLKIVSWSVFFLTLQFCSLSQPRRVPTRRKSY